MADIRFLVEDIEGAEDEQEDEGCDIELDQDDTTFLDDVIPEDLLSPVTKMDRYMNSDIIFNRQMATRCILDALRCVKTEEEGQQVLRMMQRLANDSEPSVRVELMEQIPHVALFCVEHIFLPFAVPQYVLPVVVQYLTDCNNQVRKTSQAALLVLLEQEIVERADVEAQVCPVLMQLTDVDSSDDHRTEAVALMSKMAPLVGQDISERYFLPRFGVLCSDPVFHVRKVCASNFGEMCRVVGGEATVTYLLPIFEKLCKDGVWGVRKACAECFMGVSSGCSTEMRKGSLAPLFVCLLCDKSRWVQMAAYQSLGPFIATFADPAVSGFYINDEGVLCEYPLELTPIKTEGETFHEEKDDNGIERNSVDTNTVDSGYMSPPDMITSDLDFGKCRISTLSPTPEDEVPEFSSISYWKNPLPDISELLPPEDEKPSIPDPVLDTETGENDEGKEENSQDKMEFSDSVNDTDQGVDTCEQDLTEEKSTNTEEDSTEAKSSEENKDNENVANEEESSDSTKDEQSAETSTPEEQHDVHDDDHHPLFSGKTGLSLDCDDSDDEDLPYSHIPLYTGCDNTIRNVDGIDLDDLELGRAGRRGTPQPFSQDVIPQDLLEHYISMTEPSKAQSIDTELARHCAFSFPAVTVTLGRRNWQCLRELYELLASDMQWKVRRTLAFSIHELALILGEEITRNDLVPTFNSFLRDLDEVRIGVLKHLADFIKLLPHDLRPDYLPTFSDFLMTDNNRNWRFRFELAEQLMLLCGFYTPADVAEYICNPIALQLAADRVSNVRFIAFKLISVVLKRLRSSCDFSIVSTCIQNIITKFAHSQLWSRRQTYAHLCEALLEEDLDNSEIFAREFLPSLLALVSDEVPNVRISVGRTLSSNVINNEYICKHGLEEREEVKRVLQALQGDGDRDVRHFASLHIDNYEPSSPNSPDSDSVHVQSDCSEA